MGDSSGERPSWTSLLTLDHPLAIFCPHHAEHKKKKEQEAAALLRSDEASVTSAAVARAGGGDGSSSTGCPVMATSPVSSDSISGGAGAAGGSSGGSGGDGTGDRSSTGGEVTAAQSGNAAATSNCPVSPEARSVWTSLNPSNNMMVQERQMPSPDQDSPLPTVRCIHQPPQAHSLPHSRVQIFLNINQTHARVVQSCAVE